MLQKLAEEKDKEQQRYFSDLSSNAINQLELRQPNHNQSPIETVFMLNLRESLLSYQEYFEGLLKEKDVLINKVKYSHS